MSNQMEKSSRRTALDWQDDARCKGVAVGIFYIKSHQHVARQMCLSCPVMRECRDWGDKVERSATEVFGVLGGELQAQRRNRRLEESAAQCAARQTMPDQNM